MTMRERMLAVIEGRPFDRVPFVQYDGINVAAASNEEIWDTVGRQNLGLLVWSGVTALQTPNCRFDVTESERNGMRCVTTTLHTGKGDLTEERFYEPVFNSSAASRHYLRDLTDYETFLCYLRDVVVVEHTESYLQHYRNLGDDGIPMVALQRNPWQQMWIQWASLTDFCMHMADDPDLVGACLEELGRIQLQICETIAGLMDRIPIHYVNFPDNITAPAIGVDRFRLYCMPYYERMHDLMEGRKAVLAAHMDGDLKPLWAAIGESKVNAIDSLSPPPDNDTPVGDAASMWPEKRLFVNFPSSVHLRDPEEIRAEAMAILDQAGNSGRMWIQISENVPPDVWRTSYPQIIRAVRDFGAPAV